MPKLANPSKQDYPAGMELSHIIESSPEPLTIPKLTAAFNHLGIKPGITLLCHSSLSSLGWVNGGPSAVILALEQALGKNGTLVMPSQTWSNSNPALWTSPPVPESWIAEIVATMPAFDRDFTPCYEMGKIAETFRTQAGTKRSRHPQHSFIARGPKAKAITRKHPLDFSLGQTSPLGKLYKMNAFILLLGCNYKSCTALHLAEDLAQWPWKAEVREFTTVKPGKWTELRTWNHTDFDFEACGQAFEEKLPMAVQTLKIGKSSSKLIKLADLVDFAQDWFSQNRAR